MKTVRSLIVTALAGTVSLAAVPLAHAAFQDDAVTATTGFSAGQLLPPTGLTVQKNCLLGLFGVVLGASLDLAWTPSPTSWASAQTVVVPGAVVASRTLGPTAGSVNVALPLVSGGSYTATVRATYGSWTSAPVSVTTSGC